VSLKDGIDLGTPAGRLIANVLASVASYETEVRAERIAAGKAAKAAKIDAILKAGGTPPVINKGGRPRGIPNKVTPTVASMILQMKAERKKMTVIARELNLSRQTVYEVLRRAWRRRHCGVAPTEIEVRKVEVRFHQPAPVSAFVPPSLLQRRRCKSRAGRPARRGGTGWVFSSGTPAGGKTGDDWRARRYRNK